MIPKVFGRVEVIERHYDGTITVFIGLEHNKIVLTKEMFESLGIDIGDKVFMTVQRYKK